MQPDRLAIVDRAHAALVRDGDIDLKRYMHAQERNRVIPAESLAEEGKRALLLGSAKEPGLLLPWAKAQDVVKIPPGILVLWAGWSRHGKSQMLKQVMLHAMAEGEKVCLASMEESLLFIWKEMARVACGDREPGLRKIDAWVRFQTGKLWFYDRQGQVDPAKVKAVIRYCAAELGVTQFVIDSLMMMAMRRDDYDAQAAFATELKALAEETGCTIHLVVHMRKRDGKGGEDSPGGMHDISGGHEISSAADTVFIVWRNLNKSAGNPDCVLTVDKQRGEYNWRGTLSLNFHERSRQYVEGDTAMRFWAEEVPL
jgi:twinkle protein